MRKSIYDDKVVKMLEKSGGMKASTVAAQLGTRASTIYKVLTRLVEQGHIYKNGQLFALAGAVEDVSDLVDPDAPDAPDAKVLVEAELDLVSHGISELERELHVLREIHNRLSYILGHAR